MEAPCDLRLVSELTVDSVQLTVMVSLRDE